MRVGAPLYCALQRTVVQSVRSYGTQEADKEALFALLPFADSSCVLSDARRLCLRCTNLNNAQFDENIMQMRRLGFLSPPSSPSSSLCNDETISRAPVITVELNAISADGAPREDAILQLLYGVALPLLYSRAVTNGGSDEDISAAECLSLLQHPLGASDTAWRFVPDLLSDAFRCGVRGGLLRGSATNAFRLRRDAPLRSRLISLQFWWRRRVVPRAVQTMAQRRHQNMTWEEAAQDSARQLLKEQNVLSSSSSSFPSFLTASGESAMDIIADAARCWTPCEAKPARWQIRLTDAARRELLTETMKSAQRCLVRRPAGVLISELSSVISWPALAPLLRTDGLLRTLKTLPRYFNVIDEHKVFVAQHQRVIDDLTPEEALECLTHGTRESSPSSTKLSSTFSTSLAQDIAVVTRFVGFLRRRHRSKQRVLFSELHGALTLRDEQYTSALVALRCFDVVSGLTDSATWSSMAKQAVELSSREVRALRAMESFKHTAANEQHLYEEALEPFLLKCCEVAAAPQSDGAFCLSFDALGQWVQWNRIGQSIDLAQLLNRCMTPGDPRFTLDLEHRCIQLKKPSSENETPPVSSPPPAVSDKMRSDMEGVVLETSLPPPPPPLLPPPRAPKPLSLLSRESAYDVLLARVLQTRRQDVHVHFVQTTIHAVFTLLLPIVSVPSGVWMDVLLRRVRWGAVGNTLGTLASFIYSFDGIFFEVFSQSARGDELNETVRVSAFGGPVGPFLLYTRLILKLFPSDVDVPLRALVESLSWSQYFASRFGDLPGLLRRVGRSCHNGHLLALCEATSTQLPTSNTTDDDILFELLKSIRKKHALNNNDDSPYVYCSTADLIAPPGRSLMDHAHSAPGDSEEGMALAKQAVLRLPFFFSWHSRDPSPAVLRVALPRAPPPAALARFVEAYVCPLLRRHCARPVAELDERLGWSRGRLDRHPGAPAAASQTALRGVLLRYAESAKPPRLRLLDGGLVRPNEEVYTSPEDLLLEVNGFETDVVDGEVQLVPAGRPVSLFELIAEEQEMRGGDAPVPRERKWWVAPQCDTDAVSGCKLAAGLGDILVWCDLKEKTME